MIRLWSSAWAEFVPFLQFDREIRRIVCTTNAIESVNARVRKAVKARGHFPNEQAALKCVYLAVMALDPTGKGRARWTQRWKQALNAFDITFDGRLSAARRQQHNNQLHRKLDSPTFGVLPEGQPPSMLDPPWCPPMSGVAAPSFAASASCRSA